MCLLRIDPKMSMIDLCSSPVNVGRASMSIQVTPSSLKAELNEKGWRMTPQRQTIFSIFQDLPQGEHLSVEDLHEILQSQKLEISISTIYRTVKLMARMGVLRELELAEGHKHYEINAVSAHHHHHMVCVQCNRTIEFENDTVSKQSVKQVQKSGYHLIDCQLTIFAICPEAIRYGYPALPSEDWMCTNAIADKNKHQKKIRAKQEQDN
jgi:Fur family transcriptional regulator, ferric uptake regulator